MQYGKCYGSTDNIKTVVKGYHTVLSVMKLWQAVWVTRQTTSKEKQGQVAHGGSSNNPHNNWSVSWRGYNNCNNWPVSWRGYLHCLVYSALQLSLSAWRTGKSYERLSNINRTSLYRVNKDQGVETWQQSCSWHYHLCNYRCICKCNVM